jgi:uncharacterized protein (DUF58 family)
MPARQSPLLDPQVLAQVGHHSVGARRVVEGVLTGHHRSPLRGSSIEFAEHKEYSPGDEIKHIDWKAYAKFDKFYVKQFEEETNLRGYLLVDASASMGYASGPLTKLDYAARVAATLAYLLLRQQDGVGVCLFQDNVGTYVPPRATGAHLVNVLAALERAEAAGKTALAKALRFISEIARRRSLVIVLSDLFDPDPAVGDLLRQLRSREHEVVLFHVLDHDEVDFPFEELTIFEAMESNGRLLVDPPAVREDYLAELKRFVATYERHAREAGIEYWMVDTATPIAKTLLPFLERRHSAARGGQRRTAPDRG